MPVRVTVSVALVLGIALASRLTAVDGVPDPTFSVDGRVTEHFGSGVATATAIATFPDGSLLVGGTAEAGDLTTDLDFAVVRYRSNGEVESNWGDNGRRLVPINWEGIYDDELLGVVIDATGGVTLLGSAQDDFSTRLPALARLTAQGDLDPEFGVGGRLVAEGPDFGYFTSSATPHLGGFLFTGSYCCWGTGAESGQFLFRAGADGQPDPSFGFGGWILYEETTGITGARALPDGRIVVARADRPYKMVLDVLLANGSPDPEFGSNGEATIALPDAYWYPSTLAIAEDGSIYVGLRTSRYDPVPMSGSVARVSPSGELDEAFGFPDLSLEEGSTITALAVTSDDKIVAAGPIDANGSQAGGFLVARLLPTGAFDNSFDGNGVNRIEFDLLANAEDTPLALALWGGKPVVAGFASFAHEQTAFATLRLDNRHVFASGFDAGDLSAWSGWVGYQP